MMSHYHKPELLDIEDLAMMVGSSSGMSGNVLFSIIKYMGMSQEEFGERLGSFAPEAARTRASVNDMTREVRPIPKSVSLAALAMFRDHVNKACRGLKRK